MDKTEITHLLISIITITAAFAIAFRIDWKIVFITVGLGFTMHELGHRTVAKAFGCLAVYRMWMPGLLLALVFAFWGFVFAAPGAVYIYKRYLTRRENGLISMSGALMNIILGVIFAYMIFIPTLAELGWIGFRVNIFLAMFNLIPVPPLDGSKVLAWNVGVWAILFTVCMILFFFPEILFMPFV